MTVTDTILGFIADIGLDAAKGRYKITRDELQARAKLTDYLARQQKYNFNCSLEEEIDFEGLAEYIRSNLMDDVKNRLFGTRKERGIFDKNNEQAKYVYLQQRLSTEKLKLRLVRNVETQRVKSMVLKDHIEFFDSCKDSSLAEYALKMCNDQSDTYLRSIAWRYLYHTLGAEYVADEILPIAGEELLLEIDSACKDISKKKLCEAMECEYKKKPSMQLQAHLITFGSSIAINDYATKVSIDKHPPEGAGVHIDGPTAAISSISNPVFLPQLEVLLVTVFDPDFEDCSWRGLRDSLARAFVNCGTTAYGETLELLMKHRPPADVNEGNYRYCNYTIEEIEHARKSSLDTPKTLSEAKAILGGVKKYY